MTNWPPFEPIFDSYLAVALIALGLLLLLMLGPTFSQISSRKRWTLIGLRLVVVLLVLIFMLRPTWKSTATKRETKTLILMLDKSRSMQHPHADGKSRWQAQQETVQGAQSLLQKLGDDLKIEIYAFDHQQAQQLSLEKGTVSLPPSPDGRLTDIGTSVSEIFLKHRGKRLAGMILMSDGTQTAYSPGVEPIQAAEELNRKKCPLYTIPFGHADDAGQTGDIAVEYLPDQYSVFVKNELLVKGLMRARGYVNKDLPVELIIENADGKKKQKTVVGQTVARIGEDNEQVNVSIRYTPQKPGHYKLTLRAVPQRDERVTDNNELSAFLTVLEGGLKILYLEGELRPEQKFLRRSIAASQDMDLDFQWIDHRQRDRWPVDLADTLRNGNYDVVIIGDLDSAALYKKGAGEENLKALTEAVDRGTGLIMLGGYHSFGPGRYQHTPLADVLPIEMGQFEQQDFNSPIAEDLHLAGPLTIQPVGSHFLTELGEASRNAKIWRDLPPLEGANKFASVKPASGVAVRATTSDGKPLLVSGQYGNGRVLAMAGDSTWRWWMKGHKDQHRRFWRQMILWLARRDGLSKDAAWVKLTQRRYSPGGRVEFTAGAKTAAGDIIQNAKITAHVVFADGKRQPVTLTPQGDHASGSFEAPKKPGDYLIEIVAQRPGNEPASAQTTFLVFDQDPELSITSANPEQLARLANRTKDVGGRMVAPENLHDLLRKIQAQPHHIEQEVKHKWQLAGTPWDSWLFFLCFTALLAAEWALRKKWGLV